MNVGDWVFFKTRNWPGDVQRIKPDDETAKTKYVSGERPYSGQGRVVGVAGKNYTVREALRKCGKQFSAVVDVKSKDVIIYEREHPCLKFTLCDDDKRLFAASRWCFLGSIDDWFPLCAGSRPLSQLANNYCRHIGEESFFELM